MGPSICFGRVMCINYIVLPMAYAFLHRRHGALATRSLQMLLTYLHDSVAVKLLPNISGHAEQALLVNYIGILSCFGIFPSARPLHPWLLVDFLLDESSRIFRL